MVGFGLGPTFHVPAGSSGEAQAIVAQLAMIVARMSGSKRGDSISLITPLRGCWCGSSRPKLRPWSTQG